MDLTEYRESLKEQERIRNLIDLIPMKGAAALDIGARDGYLSLALTDFFDVVTALDLEKPDIRHKKVVLVKGDVISLGFPGDSFDLVLCAEALEHIQPYLLRKACSEIEK